MNRRFFFALKQFFASLQMQYHSLTLSDKISFLAFFVSIGGMYISYQQFKESQRQFGIQRADDRKSDIEQEDRFKKQFEQISQKNEADNKFYRNQIRANAKKDSLDSLIYSHQRIHDSIIDSHTIKAQKLSVEPFLTFNISVVSDNIGYFVQNNGIGPAILTKFDIYFRGQLMMDSRALVETISNTYGDKLFFKQISIDYTENELLGRSIYANEKIGILYTPVGNLFNKENFTLMLKTNIYIDYEYQSLLGDVKKGHFGNKFVIH